jgi:uncharacterized protein YqjF (DUF2071 family)
MITLPVIQGIIRRRILVNYRVDAERVQAVLPERFRPKLHDGDAVAGICLIRLEQMRPGIVPEFLGVSSENAAHRIAVVWEEDGEMREGVYIPRRDTSSTINHLLGGRLFPGEYNAASFTVDDRDGHIDFSMRSDDGTVAVDLVGTHGEGLPSNSIFSSLDEASRFFETGSLGLSARTNSDELDAIELDTKEWRVEALDVERVRSSFFDDEQRFPSGSVAFDHALIMRNIAHEWKSKRED